jgi:hypothetical protein
MRLPYCWLRLGKWHVGIIPDDGGPRLFSERFRFAKVHRALGYKVRVNKATADSRTFFGLSPR